MKLNSENSCDLTNTSYKSDCLTLRIDCYSYADNSETYGRILIPRMCSLMNFRNMLPPSSGYPQDRGRRFF
jgi:hypothetical protein